MIEAIYQNTLIQIHKEHLGRTEIYKVIFTNGNSPLVITKAVRNSASYFWTSVPEGRQRQAEEIGRIIEKHLQPELF